MFDLQVMKNFDLVYEGGNIGLMGLISRLSLMVEDMCLGEVKSVENMHQRKAEMSLHADAFIVMPRGYGTLEELFEAITRAQLGIHNKLIGLLNIDGYYNSLLSFIEQAVEEGFIKQSAHHIIVSASNANELIEKLKDYYPCHEQVSSKRNWNSEQLEHSQRNAISTKI
ncbi:Cytokinin riboside 5'-monophosphate phosphoribohydrolase LOG protein [Dioscorea alata]|uniref:Cytokinin riboside 5'-monophosphate phosphoribohydrolase LOG protein n=1 Tax=Dioscorea alata TaxID=55571 RepID=A0ACB7UHP5_DIOAL|nr:Cytokinin riboside 5'-monophosphate phosphoribohydrolase LOG protein [Dioscorea alata]